jgi:hypothetical protein
LSPVFSGLVEWLWRVSDRIAAIDMLPDSFLFHCVIEGKTNHGRFPFVMVHIDCFMDWWNHIYYFLTLFDVFLFRPCRGLQFTPILIIFRFPLFLPHVSIGQGSIVISNVFLASSVLFLACQEAGCIDRATALLTKICDNRVYGFAPSSFVNSIYIIASLVADFGMRSVH